MKNENVLEELKKLLSGDDEFHGTEVHAMPWAKYHLMERIANEMKDITDDLGEPIVSSIEFNKPNEERRHAGIMLDVELPVYVNSKVFIEMYEGLVKLSDAMSISLPSKSKSIRISFDVKNVWTE